ncbi:FIST signal transduction protein [Flammeovirga pacifica]|uniref:Histidine kinase n=1 Tax=Flammeovirga pacifica TaxID=915059 RepID=A0A1S1YYM5_FLAPC|nr:FIST C-terminal domain-containing protein [Flammeovirga pacifica]OHX66102.1 hypothetical protein NH26_06935 [Flammeovirga pacifica]
MYYQFDNFKDQLKTQKLQSKEADVVYLFLITENDNQHIPQLIEYCNSLGISFFGGFFPKIIYKNTIYDDGFICYPIHTKNKPIIVSNNKPFDKNSLKDTHEKDIFLMFDGLSPYFQNIIEDLYFKLGSDYTIFGGGSGPLSLEQQLCVFDNNGIYKDCGILCSTSKKFNTSVQHGWKRKYGPLIATKTEKNWIFELNWRNAFEVYKEVIDNQALNTETFFEISKNHPFGVMKEGHEDIIREPIFVNNKGSIKSIGDIMENSVLYIMTAEKEDLIKATEKAAASIASQAKNPQVFMVDCISRYLFLGNDYQKEIDACTEKLKINNEVKPLIGVLSLGEISSTEKNQMVEYFNKTIVVNAIEE